MLKEVAPDVLPGTRSDLFTWILQCITIIGIPLGVANFKMAGAALVPFGKEIVSKGDLGVAPSGGVAVPD